MLLIVKLIKKHSLLILSLIDKVALKLVKNENVIDVILYNKNAAILCKISKKYKIPGRKVKIIEIENYSEILSPEIQAGYSVKKKKFLSHSKTLFKYDLKKLTPSHKVMFTRGLHKFEGIEKLANRIVLVPESLVPRFTEFLKFWKIKPQKMEYMSQ